MLEFITTQLARVAFSLILMSASAFAGNIALVVGNSAYRQGGWVFGADSATQMATALRARGYRTIDGLNMSAADLRRAYLGLIAAGGAADRLVIVLAGQFASGPADSWFLPVDATQLDAGSVGGIGLSVNALLALAGQHPGGAAVFLGSYDRARSLGPGLRPGLGAITPPQGVFVATGAPGDIDQLLRGNLLTRSMPFSAAVAAMQGKVKARGFIPAIGGLTAGIGSPPVDPAAIRERAYWEALSGLDSIDALSAYLRKYPGGPHAAAAGARIVMLRDQPAIRARAEERLLALSLDARRSIQSDLTRLGYDTRGIDGAFGPGTRAALKAWQRDRGLPALGYLTARQVGLLRQQASAARAAAEREDTDYWRASGAGATQSGLRKYLARYPQGKYADLARSRLAELQRADNGRVESAFWADVERGDTRAGYREYLRRYPRGPHAVQAQARLAALRAQKASQADLKAARNEEARMGLNIITRTLIEQRLAGLGFAPGKVDGVFTARTRAALRQFQTRNKLPATGYVTRATIARMLPGQLGFH